MKLRRFLIEFWQIIIGINPLLGKYIFQCAAVRRTDSYEEFKKEQTFEPGQDSEILTELYNEALFGITTEKTETQPEEKEMPAYIQKNILEKNKLNTTTNTLAKNIYSYNDNADYIYRWLFRFLIKKKEQKFKFLFFKILFVT